MSELALRLIEENKITQDPFLDLGNCGLIDELPEELLECYWLERLNLGGFYLDLEQDKRVESKNKRASNIFNGHELFTLEYLPKLKYLDLSYSKIQNCNFLENLNQLQYLDISSNKIEDYSFLETLLNLRYLDLRYNDISDVIFLEKLSQLQFLNLSYNKIQDINSLGKLFQLQFLDLASNQIQNVHTLEKFTELQLLNLNHNQIQDISSLENFPNLLYLDISYNQIKDISFLEKLSRLQHLDLSYNKIQNITSLEKLANLQILYLINNYIKNITPLEKLSKLHFLNFSRNKVQNINSLKKLPQLQQLHVSHNKIHDISLISRLTKLNLLDLSNNFISEVRIIKELPRLEKLHLISNKINHIEILADLPQLKDLKLDYSQITNIKLTGKFSHLETLSLRNNLITEINLLAEFPKLKSLELRFNKISKITFLKNFPQLEYLNMMNNNTKEVKFFGEFPQLKNLYLKGNSITYIESLKDLPQLRTLRLDYSQISTISLVGKFSQLNTLNLLNNNIREINFLGTFPKITSLNLQYNQISDINSIENLSQLQHLDIRNNLIQDISALQNLVRLQYLNLNNNKIQNISALQNLVQLEDLYLSNNQIDNINSLQNLLLIQSKPLDLSNNQIQDISSLQSLTQLQSLDLNNNQIKDISSLQSLIQLQSLDLRYNQIQDISSLQSLTQLQSLDLGNNRIQDINSLQSLTQLESLNLSENQIQDINSLQLLTQLQSLSLRDNQIKDISFLQQITQLQFLDLCNNQIQNISFLQVLIQLEFLNLNDNQIQDISFLQPLTQLNTLELRNNQIQDYIFLQSLIQLDFLNLSDNQIQDISFLQPLTKLKYLDLRNNQIQDIKALLILLYNGLDVSLQKYGRAGILLHENPITSPSREIIEQGGKAIIEYFEGIRKPLNECKLIFVGDGKVGKTSLMRRLVFNEFNIEEPTTHGINKIAWRDLKNEKGEEIKINLWDFGGQHIQHSLHQFFFSQRVVYVLILEPRNDQKANYWLEQIDKLGRDSETLIVYNWRDPKDKQAEYRGNFYELRKTYPKLKEPFLLSCQTGEGVDTFKRALQEAILANEGLKAEYRVEWFNIKSRLERDIPIGTNYIEYDTYQQWCNEENYPDPDRQRGLLKILDSIGSMVFFDKPVLQEYQILNPDWVTTGAYAILTAEKTMANKGHLSWEDLKKIFKEKKEIFADKKIKISYTEKQFHFIIQLMLNYDLCQENPFKRHSFLIPSAFDGIPNRDYANEKNKARQYRIQFDAPFEMLLIHRFIAKNIIRITGKDYWNSGIYIKHPSSNTFALVETSLYSNQINCWIKGDNIRGLWELIRNDFREIFNDYHNFKPNELVEYIFDGTTVFLDYEEMLDALRNGKRVIDYDSKNRIGNIDVLAVLDLFEDKNQTQKNMENEKGINATISPIINVNPHIETNIVNSNTLNQKVAISDSKELAEIKELLLELEDYEVKNEEWKNILIKSLDEFHRLEMAEEKAAQKTSVIRIDKYFKKLKDITDVINIALLPVDVVEKTPKLLDIWNVLKKVFD